MRVFLANPPWKKGERLGVRAGARWAFTMAAGKGKVPPYLPFPFFLAYATAVLEREGIQVQLVDAIAEGMDADTFLQTIVDFDPTLVLLETSTPSFYSDLDLSREIKARVPGVYLALSGPHVSALPLHTLEAGMHVDCVLVGEYEYTLRDLVTCLDAGGNLGDVLGLVWRDADGSVHINPPRPLINNLDELPWPARHLLPIRKYCDRFAELPMPGLTLWASRGCPFHCIFCVWPRVMYGGTTYRVRNPVDVVDEIEQTVQQYQLRSFSFDDDTFNIGKPRILKLCHEIKQRSLDLPWTAMARADTADQEMLEAMARAGLYAIKYGIESGVQELVDAANKNLDLKRAKEIVRLTKDLGIKVHLTFAFGLPGETWETIQRTIDFALAMDPDSAQFSIATPYPGTNYYNIAQQSGMLKTENWEEFDGADQAVIRTESLSSQELEAALRNAWRQWRWWQLRRSSWPRRVHYLWEGLKNPTRTFERLRGNL